VKVILKQDVKGLGEKNSMVNVKDGYAVKQKNSPYDYLYRLF
jgi:ribosomal protein L9